MIKTYTISNMLKARHEPLDPADLIHLLDDSNKIFTSALGQIVAHKGANVDYIPHYVYVRQRLEKYGTVHVYDGPWDQIIAEMSATELTEMINMNREVLVKVRAGEDAHGKPMVEAEERIGKVLALHHCLVNASLMCTTCQGPVTGMILEDHQRTVECKEAEILNGLDKGTLTRIDKDDEQELAKTRKIDFEFHPIGYGIFVPKWVSGAIQAYHSQNGSYAGLTLHEYLDKMSDKS